MTREQKIKEIAYELYQEIRRTQSSVCVYTCSPERSHDVEGKVVFENLDDVGLDGNFNLIPIAEWIYRRMG